MPGFLLHVNASMQCTHLGKATIAPSQPRVIVGTPAQFVATMSSVIAVAGCPFQIPVVAGTKPQPCVLVKWGMPSTRFTVAGQPVALVPAPGSGPGICQSVEQIPQGPPTVGTFQTRVMGS